MNQNFNKYIFFIVGFYVLWLLVLPVVLSKSLPVVCENLTHNTQFNINVKNPKIKLSILPIVTVKADKFNIADDSSENVIDINNPVFSIRLLPLFSGKMHINKISASNLQVTSKIKSKHELDKDFFYNLSKSRVSCDNLKLEKFNMVFRQSNQDSTVLYSGKNIIYKKNRRYLTFNANTEIRVQDKISEIKINLFLPRNNDVRKNKIDIKISNLNINPIGDFFRNYLPKDFVNSYGIIDIDVNKNNMNGVLNNCAIIMQDDAKSILFPEIIQLTSKFDLTRKTIDIKSAEIKSKNTDTHLSGKISNYLDKPLPEFDINVRLNKSKIEDFINMMPPIKTEDIDAYKLKKYKFYGDILGNFTIKGDNLEPSINGEIFINNGILTKPIPNTKGATVKLDFLGKYLNFDVFVPASISEKVWVKGGVELYNVKYSDMRVWSTNKVDLALAEEKVNPIHEILNFVIGPVPIMDVHGDGNIDITIKGNRKDPHIWGALNLNNVTAKFNDIPDMVLKNADAVLTFDDEKAVFKLKRGDVDGKKFDVNGTCTLDGKFDFDVNSNNQDLAYFYKALESSGPLVEDAKKMIPKLDLAEGLINLKLKVYGNLKYIEDLKYNENLFVKGQIDFLKNILSFNGVKITEAKGKASFDSTNASIDISSKIGHSPLILKAVAKENLADVSLSIPKLNLKDIAKENLQKNIENIFVSVNARYKGKIDKVEYDKVDFSAKILSAAKNNKLQIHNGEVSLKRGKLTINNFAGNFVDTKSRFIINLSTDDLTANPVFNGKIQLADFDLCLINTFYDLSFIPENKRKLLKQIQFDKGKINLNATIKNNNINASTNLGGIAFTYTPMQIPIRIVNGSIYIHKNCLGLDKINLMADDMPILFDGRINNIFTKPDFDLYINSKPKQDFIDKYINNNHVYPLKIKGDIVYWTKLKGTNDDIEIISQANLAKDSNIYYLGAIIGDIENAIVLNLNMNIIKKNTVKIKEFSYDKLIESLNSRKTRLNMLKASGGINILKDDLAFQDLRIKTGNPTDARIFNIIFRKPNIKQGQFTSDLVYNGKLSNPKITGTFHIFETNIPFLDTSLKSISLVFRDKTINISSVGEVFGNEIKFKGIFKNKLIKPYYIEDAEIQTKLVDLNYITNKLKLSLTEESNNFSPLEKLDLSNLVIKNIKLTANGIKLRNINAENVFAQASLNEKQVLNIQGFKFNIANGSINGNYVYNFGNNNTSLILKAKDIDANMLSFAVFDLRNQIYGDLTGDMNLSCNGSDFNKCMETLNGTSSFNVTNGRMPKLGSLEYLLKAGNLIKGGLTNLSINSVIDIITPMKTGEFSDIYGIIDIKDGIARDVEISTRGKDLSLFISGTYNFSTANAEMEVLGMLSKKISTLFGPLGNVSVNTLFNIIPGVDLTKDSRILENINKIPGIELSSKAYRKFVAEIQGNINGNDYVKSFEWIN